MISVVLTCAGNGSRFGKNKLLMKLNGKPVFVRTVECFIAVSEVNEIIAAVRKTEFKKYQKLIKQYQLPVQLVIGGEQRHISAYKAVQKCLGTHVLIHDGARPLVSADLIQKVISAVKKDKAVMVAEETFTCIKYVENNTVKNCLPRANTYLGQTPHAFDKQIILEAYKKAIEDESFQGSDDCDFVSHLGYEVKIVPGEHTNIKITYPHDLVIARQLFRYQQKKKEE